MQTVFCVFKGRFETFNPFNKLRSSVNLTKLLLEWQKLVMQPGKRQILSNCLPTSTRKILN